MKEIYEEDLIKYIKDNAMRFVMEREGMDIIVQSVLKFRGDGSKNQIYIGEEESLEEKSYLEDSSSFQVTYRGSLLGDEKT